MPLASPMDRPGAIADGTGNLGCWRTFDPWRRSGPLWRVEDARSLWLHTARQAPRPGQGSCVERFNRTGLEIVLSAYRFDSLHQLRHIAAEWLGRYNVTRSHEAAGSVPPARLREQLVAAETAAWSCLPGGEVYGATRTHRARLHRSESDGVTVPAAPAFP
jgi:hypothetical protein